MKATAVALGTFDGVHPGHRAIINAALDEAKSRALTPVIYTFAGHPMALFGKKPPLLMTDEERLDALSRFCRVEADAFTREYAATPPEDFIKMLVERFNMRCAVAGFNYTFGDSGAGDTALLASLAPRYGYEVKVVDPVLYEGTPISSTRIRASLEAGDVVSAAAMLGAPYALFGRVCANRGIGRTLGFPTANIEGFEGRVLPLDGVYATRVYISGDPEKRFFTGVTNVGCNPTVHGERRTVETHLLGFDKSIYGRVLHAQFIERIRGERDFGSVEALRERIAEDARIASEILSKYGIL